MAVEDRLTVESVIADARGNTGLEDLGDEHFLVPLRMLLQGLGNLEGRNRMIRRLARGSLVHFVENRMLIHDAVRRDPSVAARPVLPPLVVTGLPRTGTTLLHNLLARDPNARPLLFYEALSPVPDGAADERSRVRKARSLVGLTRALAPEMAKAHALRSRGPEECLPLLQNTFVTPFMIPFLAAGQMQYRAWLEGLTDGDRDRSYAEYLLQLRILQETDAERRWALKCPCHLFGLASLLRVVPGAMVVQTHRDVVEALPSLCSLQAMMAGVGEGASDREELGRTTTSLAERLLRWGVEARTPENEGRIADVRYAELVTDPVGTVRGVYAHFGLPFSTAHERAMSTWLEENPPDRHGEHRYAPEDFGLETDAVARRFEWYHERFDLRLPV